MSEENSRAARLQGRLREVPHKPGVYLMRDRLGYTIYVGKARDLRKRLANYFTPSRRKMAEHKTRALIHSIHDFDYHTVASETEALLLEGQMIKEYRPKYNVTFRDDKRFLLVRMNLEEPWPRFTLTRLRKDDGAKYFGPYAHADAIRVTVDWLNRHFGLRFCRPKEPGEKDFRHCHKDLLKNCSAPCVGRITPEEYKARALHACEFLDGKSKELIDGLEQEMKAAAEVFEFEKAAEIRDMIQSMRESVKPFRTFVRKRGRPSTPDYDGKAVVAELGEFLSLPSPPRVMECFDISNISTTHCVASMVRFRDGLPDFSGYRRYRIRVVDGQNDFASMSEVVRRRYSAILRAAATRFPEETGESQANAHDIMRSLEKTSAAVPVRLPDLIVVDGGKGQISAALDELRKLGLSEIPLIGLAKEEELVFRPGVSEPLRLSHGEPALKLLQRARDEAHRIANGYHQILLRQRMSESLLDEIPGLGAARKALLLKKFGSVKKLRQADVKEISTLPGISTALASRILENLAPGKD